MTKSIQCICEAIIKNRPSEANDSMVSYYKQFGKLRSILISEKLTTDNLSHVFNLYRKVFLEFKLNRNYIEKEILSLLSITAIELFENDDFTNLPILHQDLLLEAKDENEKNQHETALALKDFSLELLRLKRPRDSFGGKRREKAFEILSSLDCCYELPDIISLAVDRVSNCKSQAEILSIIEFFKIYYLRRDIQPPSDILDTLENLIDETDNRSLAVAALDLMVETGEISELDALSRIDDWKERYYESEDE